MIDKIKNFISQSFSSTKKYLIGKLITSLILSAVCLIVFLILDLKILGLIIPIIFFTNFVPIFGPWIGTLSTALIVLFQDPLLALYTVITTLIVQLIEQFILIPLIIGKAIDIKPLFIIIVIILSSIFLGFWGVLFAIPIASILKIGYDIFIKREKKQ